MLEDLRPRETRVRLYFLLPCVVILPDSHTLVGTVLVWLIRYHIFSSNPFLQSRFIWHTPYANYSTSFSINCFNILICSLLEKIPGSISHQMLIWLLYDVMEQSGIMFYFNYKKGAKNNIPISEVLPLNTGAYWWQAKPCQWPNRFGWPDVSLIPKYLWRFH